MLRIVHLSDIHFNGNAKTDFDEFIVKALIKDLKRFNEEKKIDLVFITGDLIDKGGDGFDKDIELALLNFEESFLKRIKDEIGLEDNKFFIIPGNHDVDQSGIVDYIEDGLKNKLTNTESVNRVIDSNDTNAVSRAKKFKDFEKALHSNYPYEYTISNFQSTYKYQVDDYTIGINCLNSAWRCYDSKTDKEKLIIGERQFTKAREIIEDCNLKIALVHHTADWLAEFDNKCSQVFLKDYDMVFCGHVHEGACWTKTNMYGTNFISVTASNWTNNIRSTDRIFANGYSIIDFDRRTRGIKVSHRRYCYSKEDYDPNTDLGDAEGKCTFNLKGAEALDRLQSKIKTIKHIESVHKEEKNEHLLSYYSDSKAPKSINEIFVMPNVVNKIEYDIEKAKEVKHYTIADLCTMDESYIIYGSKEIGKTLLLDKIFIEFLDKPEEYDKIPVYIDFEEFTHSRFETAISHFLGIGITEIGSFLEENKLVLLVDNLSFDKRNNRKLQKLEDFLEKSAVQLIAAVTYTLEGEIPVEILEYSYFASLNSVTIKYFKTKEIRELMSKWFINNKDYDTPEKLDSLIQVFSTYNLPSTPLAVSMFLWIIEQQENYKPVNNAAMLENFIERTFLKHSKEEVYSEDFDYTNKLRLLADIAYEMYTLDEDSYRIPFTKLRDFVHSYLKKRKFAEFSEEEILNEFLSKGILMKEYFDSDVFIRFRFTCFFQFFLMKKIEFDEGFKKYVLEEENYLNFVDEIDYYTALKRDQVAILTCIIERMENEFKSISEKINSFPYSYDSVFETRGSMTNSLDGSFVAGIKSAAKPDEKEFDTIKDSILDNLSTEKGIQKKDNIRYIDKLARMWMLAAKVLKNSEEIEIGEMKLDYYTSIMKSSLAFANLYKVSLAAFIEKQKEKGESVNEQLRLANRFLPLMHQILLFNNMGTGKLRTVLKEKIELDLKNDDITDIEVFTSIFTYADLRGTDYIKYIKEFVKRIERNYIYDMTLIKLVTYYFLRSNKTNDNIYENLIADLIVSSKGENKSQKGKIIQDYRNKRLLNTKMKPTSEENL